MSLYIPDNYDRWKAHERARQQLIERLPVCDYCGEPIQDEHFYLINGEYICPTCLDEQFRQSTDDYTEEGAP